MSSIAKPPPRKPASKRTKGVQARWMAQMQKWQHLWRGQTDEQAAAAATANTMLPLLIEVFAAFSKLDGSVEEEDVESSLGYLR
ncbi:MAG: hypothetical protein ACKO8Z_15995 [Prosthecobacter sp.]